MPLLLSASQVLEKPDRHTTSAVPLPGQAYQERQEQLAQEFKQRAGPC